MSDHGEDTGALVRLTRLAPDGASPAATLSLGFADRRRSRHLARLDDGREVGLSLPRGTILRDGDRLSDDEARLVIGVRAAPETLSVARTADAHLLARAAYHLGNRHVPLQVAADHVAYQHDHVLDDMVRTLGLAVTTARAPFEPEAGGYRHEGNGRRAHGRHHGHEHEDHHGHDGER